MSRMCVLKSRQVFTDTCFSHSYVTLFPSGVVSFWYMLLFISDQGTIPVVEELLESAVRSWKDTRNWSFRPNSLETPQFILVGAMPRAKWNLCREPAPWAARGWCCTAQILGKVKHYSDVSISAPGVLTSVWETLSWTAAPAPMGKASPGCKWGFEIFVFRVQQN